MKSDYKNHALLPTIHSVTWTNCI